MAMASCSLHENPFLTWTSGGNPALTSFVFFALLSGSQLEYLFHRFRFFGKNACAMKIQMIPDLVRIVITTGMAGEERTSMRTKESASTALKNWRST
jgi:hypothetical protein